MAASPSTDTPDPTAAELIAARPHLAMHAMDGLVIDDVPLNAIADDVGTPVWVYSASAMRRRCRMLAGALADAGLDAHVHYAMKANDRLAVLRLFAAEGAGADIVSEGELRRARAAGIPADRIVFSGVGKSERELRLALTEDIAQINVESAEELAMLSAVAAAMDRTARVVLRVNPDVDAGTHAKITTGRAQDKFGIPYADAVPLYRRASELPGILPIGLATHIGSQILSLAPYRAAYGRLADLVRALRADGLPISVIDCGGGLGIPYRNEPAPLPAAFAGAIRARAAQPRCARGGGAGTLAGRTGGRAAGLRHPGKAYAGQPLRRARRGDERPDPSRHVRCMARHRADFRGRCRGAGGTGRRGGTGLRGRRHLCAQPHAAAAGGGRPGGDPRCRRLWLGDEFGLQCAPRGGRGDGGRQRLVGDPRA